MYFAYVLSLCIYINTPVFCLCIIPMYIYQYTALTASLAALTAHRQRPHGMYTVPYTFSLCIHTV